MRRRSGRHLVKSHGSTVELRGEPPDLRKVGANGTMGGAVKCVDIDRNAKGEVRQLGLS